MAKRADTMLMYSDTGGGKTSQIGEMAKWEYVRSGKITRLISGDSGWDPVEDLVWTPEKPFGTSTPSGPVCIEAWNIQYLPNPFPVIVKLSEGCWPKIVSTPLGQKIVVTAPKHGWGPDGPPASAPISGTEAGLLSADGSRAVGQVAVEGLSTICAILMQDHIRTLRKIAEDIVGDFSAEVDVQTTNAAGQVTQSVQSLKFGKSGRAHYGHVQDFVLLDLVPRFATLPVERVIWTAHEAKGTDDITGQKDSVLGPATIGKAAVAKTAMKFGDTFHLVAHTRATPNAQTRASTLETEYRAYYQEHPDEALTKMHWPAKLSLPLSRVAELRERFPGGFVPLTLTGGMERWLEFKHGNER